MYRKLEITPVRTYATEANAWKAVEKAMGKELTGTVKCSVAIMWTKEGRCFPMVCNAGQHLSEVIHCGFNVVN